jgi:hypothetical protein
VRTLVRNTKTSVIIKLLENCLKIKKCKSNISKFKKNIKEYNNDLNISSLTLKERDVIIDNIRQFELKLAKEKSKFKRISAH